MNRAILLWTIYLFSIRSVYAQTGVLEGILFNKLENKGFAYAATILLPALKMGTVSDANGHFRVINVPSGIYEVKIESIGYRDTTILQVEVVSNKTTKLNMNFPIGCHVLAHKGKICPYCHKEDLSIPIIYGLPNRKVMRMAERREIQLGGCVATGCDPQWYCRRDDHTF